MTPEQSKIEIRPIHFKGELFFEIKVIDYNNECSIQVTYNEALLILESLSKNVQAFNWGGLK